MADLLGYALFTPLTLVLFSRESYRNLNPRTVLQGSVSLVALAVATWVVFAQSQYELTFALTSAVVLIALRLGFCASVLSVNVLAILATGATSHGSGPFVLGAGVANEPRVAMLQGFLTLNMMTVFAVSVIQLEREAFQKRLQGAYARMEQLATIDPLTGVSNRRRFEEALQAVWQRAIQARSTVSLLMIDADHFKSYNDTFGHPAGDECLRAMVGAVTRTVDSAGMLARYGGEEFVLMLPGSSREEAAAMAEAVRVAVEHLYEEPHCYLHRRVTVSIGCATVTPDEEIGSRALIAAADRGLYRAKENGRNRVEIGEVDPNGSAHEELVTRGV